MTTRAKLDVPMTTLSPKTRFRGVPAMLAFLIATGLSGSALATEELPGVLQEAIQEATGDFDCLPACSTCHTTEPGQAGTATKPLAQLLLGNQKLTLSDGSTQTIEGLELTQPETLKVAFMSLDGADMIEDGVIKDPVSGAVYFDPSQAACQAEVDYGCSIDAAGPTGQTSVAWWAPLLLSALGLGVFLRRRRAAN